GGSGRMRRTTAATPAASTTIAATMRRRSMGALNYAWPGERGPKRSGGPQLPCDRPQLPCDSPALVVADVGARSGDHDRPGRSEHRAGRGDTAEGPLPP